MDDILNYWKERYGKYYNIKGKQELIRYWKANHIVKDEDVLKAFERIKRENFVKPDYRSEAYRDEPLPIGYDATISQPTTIVMMLNALELRKGNNVLEVGSGSGYAVALIAEIVKPGKVVGTEIINELVEFSKKNLAKEKIKNAKIVHTDGSKGYGKEAPYDRIIVSAGSYKIPEELIKQLKNKGIMVIPVGPEYGQKMVKIRKKGNKIETEDLGEFVFVPLKQS